MLMQTKLRAAGLAIVACLLGTCPASAAIQPQNQNHTVARNAKPRYVGIASWYGKQHQGRKMANGQKFDRRKLTAACWWFPLGTVVRVVNVENGKAVTVTITDRGPNRRLNRVLDLSEAAADQLGYIGRGLTRVFLAPVAAVETQDVELNTQWVMPAQIAMQGGDE